MDEITDTLDELKEIFLHIEDLVLQNNELENVIPDNEIKFNIRDHAGIFY